MSSAPVQRSYLVKITLILLTVLMTMSFVIKTLADDKCKNIDNIDDKAKCYADTISKKQNEYESTTKKLQDITNEKNSIASQITKLGSQLNVTADQINSVQASIDKVTADLQKINDGLNMSKETLAKKIELRNRVIRNYSKRSILNDMEMFIALPIGNVSLNGFERAITAQAYSHSINDEIVKIVKSLNGEIQSYEADKKEGESLKNDLEDNQARLVALKRDLDSKKNSAQADLTDVSKQEATVKSKLENLQHEIDTLSSRQKEILNQKNGDSSGTVGDYDSPDSSTPNPSFSPAFAAFSYGAYSHYNGMSQYGAKGRADSGQDYKEILKFYYKVGTVKKSDFPTKISVQGYGTMDFQKYLYGIAEMPSNWNADALKAQAVAARTYANMTGKPICTTQSCQVFLKSKSDNPPASWKKAVDDTKNEILDNPKTAQYSSTTGGYINNVGWDVDGKWPGDAYEKKAKSPWFYKAWYTKSYGTSDSCGRGNPWMTEKEMADILNAWVVWKSGNSSDKSRIAPVTTSCWGGNPYSMDSMAKRADELGEKYGKVTSVDVSISNSGYTSKVTLGTDNGTVTMDGETFKTVFNLRAPGYVSIKSRLFDLEKK